MKKRFLLCMLVALVLMSLVFAGCGKSDGGSAANAGGSAAIATDEGDAYDAFIEAAEALNNAENVSMDMNMSISSGDGSGMTMSGPVQMMRENGKLQMFSDVAMESAGQTMAMKTYYRDGFIYVDMAGTKMKSAQTENEVLTANNSGAQIFDREYVKDIKTEENADGTLITITIDGEGLAALTNSMAETDAAVETDIEYGDATMLAQLDSDGAMAMQDITMFFTTSGIETEVHSVLNIVGFGSAAITFPDDLDSYTELDAQSAQ